MTTARGDAPSARDDVDVAFAGVTGQAALLAEGSLTSVELVELLLRRIERLQPSLNAFRVVLAGDARRDAAAADAARHDGDSRPLLGVPIAVKDNVRVAGQSALFGTGSPEVPAGDDDELVLRLRAAGMIVLGLTHLPELALWAATESQHHGVTRNPWRRDLAPGGSSGGSAAAVAAGLVPAAHGTDGLGSIRIPASSCGLVGLKPTHGLVPLGPDPDHWEGLSHAGFLTRSVQDTALLLDAVAQPPTSFTEASDEPASLRVAYSIKTLTPVKVHPQVRAVFDETLGHLHDLGHTTALKDAPFALSVSGAGTVRYLAGVAADVRLLVDPLATERRTRTLASIGRTLPHRTVSWARRHGDELRERMGELFADCDVLMTPTMPTLPLPAGSITGRGLTATLRANLPRAGFTGMWNSCGLPAVSVPVGRTPDGVPVGMQLIGPPLSEGRLLGLARSLERVCGWTSRRPPVD
jgi:amidase